MTRIAVFGASGFIGATFVERMVLSGHFDIKPVIHNSGNAWRLSRHGLRLAFADALGQGSVRAAMKGCSHVVNCILGGKQVMIRGLDNILRACLDEGIHRFVHISSVSVYDGQPPGSLVSEDTPVKPKRRTYGWIKCVQDDMVQRACRKGLPIVILAPPNISGIYSPFLMRVMNALNQDRFALVESGTAPCDLIDVQDVARSIEMALCCDQADASRIFITQQESTTWLDLLNALTPMIDCGRNDIANISRKKAYSIAYADHIQRLSVKNSIRMLFSRLLSREFRSMISGDPLLQRTMEAIRSVIGRLPTAMQKDLLTFMNRSQAFGPEQREEAYDPHVCGVQWRAVHYSQDRAKQILKYQPQYSFHESIDIFNQWYRDVWGLNKDYSLLLRQL